MRRPIVLFSTTRMYNPGDDFVLFGIRRLLEEALGPFVPVVHNRNPALHALRGLAEASAGRPDSASAGMAELHRTIAATVPDYDNSWHPGFDMGAVDLAVFAGTPEWAGTVTAPLVDALLAAETPMLYLGLGAFEGIGAMDYAELPVRDRRLLERARLVTVRDPACAALLAPLSPALLPCPRCSQRPKRGRVANRFGSHCRCRASEKRTRNGSSATLPSSPARSLACSPSVSPVRSSVTTSTRSPSFNPCSQTVSTFATRTTPPTTSISTMDSI